MQKFRFSATYNSMNLKKVDTFLHIHCTVVLEEELNFCPFSDRFRDFTLWFTFMEHKKCVCIPALKRHKTTFLGERTWNDTSLPRKSFWGGQKMKQDMGISLCDKHMHKKRLSLASCGRLCLAFFLSWNKVVLQKSQGDLHAKCNLFTGWHNGFIFLFKCWVYKMILKLDIQLGIFMQISRGLFVISAWFEISKQ